MYSINPSITMPLEGKIERFQCSRRMIASEDVFDIKDRIEVGSAKKRD